MNDGQVGAQRIDKRRREGVSNLWVLHLTSRCLGTAYVLEVCSLIHVLEGYFSPIFSTPVSYCCVVLPIPVLVANIYSPRYVLETHNNPAYVLELSLIHI